MAWAHGTVGIADKCAPSWAGRSQRDVDYLNHWLGQGYVVVASDYQGLGVPGRCEHQQVDNATRGFIAPD